MYPAKEFPKGQILVSNEVLFHFFCLLPVVAAMEEEEEAVMAGVFTDLGAGLSTGG